MRIGLLVNLLAFAIITTVALLVGLVISLSGVERSETLISAAVVFVILITVIVMCRRQIKTRVLAWGLRLMLGGLKDQFGIIRTYDNYINAQEDIKNCFENSQEICIFSSWEEE